MWIFFFLGPVAFVVAAIVHALARSKENGLLRAAEQQAASELGEHGRLEGAALGDYRLQANPAGVPVTITARVSARVPGAKAADGDDDPAARTVWLAEVPVELPPRVVVRKLDAVYAFEAVGAPLATGSKRFDDTFVTTPNARGARDGSAYRATAEDGARWITANLAERLCELELQWIEAKRGSVVLAFGPLGASSVGAALTAAASLAHTARGEPELPLARHTLTRPQNDTVIGNAATLVMGAGIATVLGAPLGAAIAFLPPVHESVQEASCGPGATIEITSSEDDEGTSYGLQCRDHPEGSVALAYLLAICIWCTLVLGAGIAMALRSWPERVGLP